MQGVFLFNTANSFISSILNRLTIKIHSVIVSHDLISYYVMMSNLHRGVVFR